MERDKEWNTEKKDITDFNSHAHVERDMLSGMSLAKTADFNSHAHVERDWINAQSKHAISIFQLTRSRGA